MAELRSLDDINKEYSTLCARAGQLQYQMFIMTNDLKMINESIRELNNEAAAVHKANAKAAEEATVAESVTPA